MPYNFLPIFGGRIGWIPPTKASLTSAPSRSRSARWQDAEHRREDNASCYNRPAPGHAGVAELVDAPDSKSGAPRGACRFEPDLRYS